jgi:hypothetical protein
MKTFKETLEDIVTDVKNHSEDPVTELLNMGFTPYQLAHYFGFEVDEVKKSEAYRNFDEDLDYDEYPFIMNGFNRFDAQLISHFKMDLDTIRDFKDTTLYEELLDRYNEDKEDALTDVMNDIFGEMEDEVYEWMEGTE